MEKEQKQVEDLANKVNEIFKGQPIGIIKKVLILHLTTISLVCGHDHPVMSQAVLLDITKEVSNIIELLTSQEDGN